MIPAPMTAVGMDAPAEEEDDEESEEPLLPEDEPAPPAPEPESESESLPEVELEPELEVADDEPSVPRETEVTAVLFEPIEEAIPLLTAVIFAMPVVGATRVAFGAAAVIFASAELAAALLVASGTRYVCTSDGSAVNQVGVSPALNCDAISLDTAAELVSASATREDGRAVCRTWRTETLCKFSVSHCYIRLLRGVPGSWWQKTHSSWVCDACGTAKADAARADTVKTLYCIFLVLSSLLYRKMVPL